MFVTSSHWQEYVRSGWILVLRYFNFISYILVDPFKDHSHIGMCPRPRAHTYFVHSSDSHHFINDSFHLTHQSVLWENSLTNLSSILYYLYDGPFIWLFLLYAFVRQIVGVWKWYVVSYR